MAVIGAQGDAKEEHGPLFPSVYLKSGDLYGYVVCVLDATLPRRCEQRDKLQRFFYF